MEPVAMLSKSQVLPDHIEQCALSESLRMRSNQQRCKVYGREESLVLSPGRLPHHTYGQVRRRHHGANHHVSWRLGLNLSVV